MNADKKMTSAVASAEVIFLYSAQAKSRAIRGTQTTMEIMRTA